MEFRQPQHESAHIITHKHQFIQPNFLEFPKEKQIGADSHPISQNKHSEIQQSAFSYFDIGLNPFPLPLGKKGGYPWKKLQYTRLDREHEQYGLFMLFSGNCNLAIMCGRTSRNLFVIDCESPHALQFHIKEMQKRKIPLWVSETQRGGHIYMLSADGEVDNITTGILKEAEIKGSAGYVLAPPSIHPGGKQYKWLYKEGDEPPTIAIQDVNWLRDFNGNKISLQAHQSKSMKEMTVHKRPFSPLSKRTLHYIQNGHTIPEGSRNNELFSASCDMVGNNYSYQDTFAILSAPAVGSGLLPSEIDKTVKSAFSQPRTPAKPKSKFDTTTSDWQWATIYADHHQWDGRNRTSKHAIFSALIHRAKVSSNEDGLFRASIREIATLSRTGTATVQRVLKELEDPDKPYIIKCGNDRTSRATLWKFPQHIILEAQQVKLDTLKESPQWLSCSVSNFSLPDAVERTGLGYNGLLVYRAMMSCNEPLFSKSLSQLTGLTSYQVKYAMKKLRSFDLIYRCENGWLAHVLSDDELDMKVHEKKEIIGKGVKRAERFARERAVYAGRHLFYARLRYERQVFKRQVYKTLRQIHDVKYPTHLPIYREFIVDIGEKRRHVYRRVPLSDFDENDRSLIECALSLGGEIIIQAKK